MSSRIKILLFALALSTQTLWGCVNGEGPQTQSAEPHKARIRLQGRFPERTAQGASLSEPANIAKEANPAFCHADSPPVSEPASALSWLANRCAAPGFIPKTPVHIGNPQGEADADERLSFLGRKGRCYRVFAAASEDVGDLDIAVFNSTGGLAAADVSEDRYPVVPPRGFLCLREDETFSIRVAVVRGQGNYVLQVWGSE